MQVAAQEEQCSGDKEPSLLEGQPSAIRIIYDGSGSVVAEQCNERIDCRC